MKAARNQGRFNIRIPERSTQAKRKAARLARRGDLASHRKQARETVASLLANLPAKLPELPDDVADAIEDAALVTAWGRGAVPRNGYGRREIEGVPVVEEPMRLVQQLGTLARGVLALGLPSEAAADIARRVALTPCQRHAAPSYRCCLPGRYSAHPHAPTEPGLTGKWPGWRWRN